MDKKYLKQVALYVLSVILSIGLMLYIGYHLFYGLTQKTETATATVATVGSALEMDVYIFRDEIPLTASSAGSCVPSAADGEKVGVGRIVASLYEASSPDTVSRIAGLEKQILVLEQIKNSNLSVRDTASIDGEIYNIVENIVSAAYELHITVPESLRFIGEFDDVFKKYTRSARITRTKTTNMGSQYKLV